MAAWEVLLALLVSVGLGALLRLGLERLFAPASWQSPLSGAILLPVQGAGESAELAVKALRHSGGAAGALPLILVDRGLSGEGKALVQTLTAGREDTVLCAPEALEQYIRSL